MLDTLVHSRKSENNAIACFLYFEAVTCNLSFIGHMFLYASVTLQLLFVPHYIYVRDSRQFPL